MCWQFIRPPVRLADGDLPLSHVVCLLRAVSTSPGSPGRFPRAFTRHFGTDGRRRRGERPIQRSWSIVTRSTSGAPGIARRPRDRTVSMEEERRSLPVAVAGNSGSTRSHALGPSRRARRHLEACREALTSAGGVLMSRRDDRGVLPPSNEGVGLCVPIDGRSSPRRCSGRCWKTFGSAKAMPRRS
jgi:hypothetical protein